MKAPANATKRLKAEAEKLTDLIFHRKHCIVHLIKSGRLYYYKVEKHHLIHKSRSVRFKFNIWNILPVCQNDHTFDNLSAHEAEEKFLVWVKDKLPLHWSWYQDHRNESTRHISPAEWSEICDELRHYVKHPLEAEKIIYERG